MCLILNEPSQIPPLLITEVHRILQLENAPIRVFLEIGVEGILDAKGQISASVQYGSRQAMARVPIPPPICTLSDEEFINGAWFGNMRPGLSKGRQWLQRLLPALFGHWLGSRGWGKRKIRIAMTSHDRAMVMISIGSSIRYDSLRLFLC